MQRKFPKLWIWTLATGLVAWTAMGATAQASPSQHTQPPDTVPQGCILIVPNNPLSARGLATPFQLTGDATNDNADCLEENAGDSVFVQAAVLNVDTGAISIYEPLVIDKGSSPAIAPVVPRLPRHAVVGLWFGSNNEDVRLQGAGRNTLKDAVCVNGLGQSDFGQVSYCNAVPFFAAVNLDVRRGLTHIPALGTGTDGQACPTTRDFSIVDQDPSDNVTTRYLLTTSNQIAQDTAANQAAFPGATVMSNGSDNNLLDHFVDPAIGCTPWLAPDLADPGSMVSSQPLNELQAAAYQKAPIAFVELTDEMAEIGGFGGTESVAKLNLYRAGVDQPREPSLAQAQADDVTWCRDVVSAGIPRLELDEPYTSVFASPDPTVGTNLYTFLATRISVTLGPAADGGADCTNILGISNPVNLTVNGVGVTTAASFS